MISFMLKQIGLAGSFHFCEKNCPANWTITKLCYGLQEIIGIFRCTCHVCCSLPLATSKDSHLLFCFFKTYWLYIHIIITTVITTIITTVIISRGCCIITITIISIIISKGCCFTTTVITIISTVINTTIITTSISIFTISTTLITITIITNITIKLL